ncbi:hypothetical protein Tco_1490889 [Tanacetum coccineum]
MNRRNVLTERTEYPYLKSSKEMKEMGKKDETTPASRDLHVKELKLAEGGIGGSAVVDGSDGIGCFANKWVVATGRGWLLGDRVDKDLVWGGSDFWDVWWAMRWRRRVAERLCVGWSRGSRNGVAQEDFRWRVRGCGRDVGKRGDFNTGGGEGGFAIGIEMGYSAHNRGGYWIWVWGWVDGGRKGVG